VQHYFKASVSFEATVNLGGWSDALCQADPTRLRAAARAVGASNRRIIIRHILPNAVGPVVVWASFGIAGAILTETALSFLGFGVQPPTASWGTC